MRTTRRPATGAIASPPAAPPWHAGHRSHSGLRQRPRAGRSATPRRQCCHRGPRRPYLDGSSEHPRASRLRRGGSWALAICWRAQCSPLLARQAVQCLHTSLILKRPDHAARLGATAGHAARRIENQHRRSPRRQVTGRSIEPVENASLPSRSQRFEIKSYPCRGNACVESGSRVAGSGSAWCLLA